MVAFLFCQDKYGCVRVLICNKYELLNIKQAINSQFNQNAHPPFSHIYIYQQLK